MQQQQQCCWRVYKRPTHLEFSLFIFMHSRIHTHWINPSLQLSCCVMRTRRGPCYSYPKLATVCVGNDEDRLFKRRKVEAEDFGCREESRFSSECPDLFDALPDDLVLFVLCKLSSAATCPADFINVLITCKRLNELGMSSIVLSKACRKMLAVKAKNWSESAHRFLKLCADTGNAEACYTLGMIRFYCLHNRGNGTSLMAKAAIASHAPSLYSLAVIQFNGSGGSKTDKDLRAGVALSARAAFLGHIDALRELGHCLQDGYGVKKNISDGRRFLIQANARELAAVLAASPAAVPPPSWHGSGAGCPLLSDFGCNVPSPAPHPANQFLTEWFVDRTGDVPGPGLRLCSHSSCGRPETRRHEFRRCSVCGAVNYCSRACQALDWKLRHKAECAPVEDDGENEDLNDR